VDAIAILRGGIKQGHDIMEQAVANLTPEQLHHRGEGSTIHSIALIYAHTVMSEDWLMNTKLRDQASIFERAGLSKTVGIEMVPFGGDPEPWIANIPNVDFDALRRYAAQVYTETDDYLATLTEADLDGTVTFIDEMPIGAFLSTIIGWHAAHHGGEICALKGVLGGKGLPF
jgi:hypothetical protein